MICETILQYEKNREEGNLDKNLCSRHGSINSF